MQRILIIGSGGAGKSTLARRLGEITGIEIIHLDKLYWLPGWTEPSKADWLKTIDRETLKNAWIMDGNFGSSLDVRLKRCDTVLFLEMPRLLCAFRALKRAFRYRGETRPDMGALCNEKFDLEFLRWIWNFPKKDKLKVEGLLEKHGGKAKIIRLKSKSEVEEFLKKTIQLQKGAKNTK